MGFEESILFSVFGRPVTAYALCLALAAGIGLWLFAVRGKKQGIPGPVLWHAALLSVPFGLIGARVFYCVCMLNFYAEMGFDAALRLWEGGYALWGAVGGVTLAAVIAAKTGKQPAGKLLDALAPSAALVIGLMRLAEYFSGEGVGLYVEDEAFCRFPLAVCNQYGEWHFAIFLLEALAALVIFAVLLRSKRKNGDLARLFLLLYCACQIVLESMRRDNYLRWLFVRVSQLTSVLVIAGMMIAAVIRWARNKEARHMTGKQIVLCWAVVLACAGICVALEFSVDGKILPDIPVWADYALMACCCAGIGAAAYRVIFHSIKTRE